MKVKLYYNSIEFPYTDDNSTVCNIEAVWNLDNAPIIRNLLNIKQVQNILNEKNCTVDIYRNIVFSVSASSKNHKPDKWNMNIGKYLAEDKCQKKIYKKLSKLIKMLYQKIDELLKIENTKMKENVEKNINRIGIHIEHIGENVDIYS